MKLNFRSIALSIVYWISFPIIIGYYLSNNIYSFNGSTDIIISIIILTIIISIAWFTIYELYYWLYWKNRLIDILYTQLLCWNNFPNPWNYHFSDGFTYFLDISWDENIDTKIRLQSMKIYAELKSLGECWKIAQSNRVRYAMFKAIDKYFHHFKDEQQDKPNMKKTFNHRDSHSLPYILFCIFS